MMISAIPVWVAVGCNTAELQVPPVDPPETFDASRDARRPGDAADETPAPDVLAPTPDTGGDSQDAGSADASDARADAAADAKIDG